MLNFSSKTANWSEIFSRISQITAQYLSDQQSSQIIQYLTLLEQWNLSHGLLSLGELPRLIDRHLLDSVFLSPLLPSIGYGIDLGSGNGFPAIVLAILHPGLKILLTESNTKKCRFLRFVIHRLSLSNAVLHEGRIEALPSNEKFSFCTSRAFSSLLQTSRLVYPLLPSGSPFFAMKGFHVEHDLAEFSSSSYAEYFLPPVVHTVSPESNIIVLTRV